MSRSLDDLDPRIRPLADRLIQEAGVAGISLIVTDTLRTPAEQRRNVEAGVSWTMSSKHLPQPPLGKALAFDVAPRVVLAIKGWAPWHRYWQTLGAIGQRLGLKWGVVLEDGRRVDLGHFEYKGV